MSNGNSVPTQFVLHHRAARPADGKLQLVRVISLHEHAAQVRLDGAAALTFEQHEALVICVSPGLHGKWDISEQGLDRPLTRII
ncbi:hypothetical protein D3871_12395 [Noviherbaspirillum saxi]|uniref:Uncharacterized protein n=1 Tax=Noviherbaspirillum saxi TaxID=2320863 RepID=A0A3A3GE95_9BURK|nr:hypothetical protein D3871_12395 [Noviherbaspirillum saxi]